MIRRLADLIRRAKASLRNVWRDPLQRRLLIGAVVGFALGLIVPFIYAALRH